MAGAALVVILAIAGFVAALRKAGAGGTEVSASPAKDQGVGSAPEQNVSLKMLGELCVACGCLTVVVLGGMFIVKALFPGSEQSEGKRVQWCREHLRDGRLPELGSEMSYIESQIGKADSVDQYSISEFFHKTAQNEIVLNYEVPRVSYHIIGGERAVRVEFWLDLKRDKGMQARFSLYGLHLGDAMPDDKFVSPMGEFVRCGRPRDAEISGEHYYECGTTLLALTKSMDCVDRVEAADLTVARKLVPGGSVTP